MSKGDKLICYTDEEGKDQLVTANFDNFLTDITPPADILTLTGANGETVLTITAEGNVELNENMKIGDAAKAILEGFAWLVGMAHDQGYQEGYTKAKKELE